MTCLSFLLSGVVVFCLLLALMVQCHNADGPATERRYRTVVPIERIR